MSSEEIIRAWKDDDDEQDTQQPQDPQQLKNPAGDQELTDEDLENISGGRPPTETYGVGCYTTERGCA